MSRVQVIDDFKVLIDPETNFWVIYDSEMPENALKLYEKIGRELKLKMERYRFEVDFNTVYVNITERCNTNCPYCYIPERVRKRRREFSSEDLRSLLKKFEELGIRNVVFHGVEPLLMKKQLYEIIDDHKQMKFGIQTNGFLMEEEDADFFKEKKVNVGVSFDSPSREIEDYLRGRGHFDKICKILEWFKGYKEFYTITTITRLNYSQLSDLIDFLAGKVRLVLMNPVRGTSEGGRNLRADPKEAAIEFVKAVEKAIEYTKSGKRIVIGDFANIVLGIVAPYSRVLQCDISPCGGGRRFFAITPDGVFPCSEFIGMEEFRSPLHVVNNPERLRESFRIVRERIVERIEECKDCVYRNICGSPCPAEVYAEKGSLFSKSPNCEFYKILIEHAFRVIKRGNLESVVNLEKMKKVYEIKV
ncbi:MAG: peptide-modifying radical SAM enzyme CbpB [Candidatus Nezhaarchaeales archaeon]